MACLGNAGHMFGRLKGFMQFAYMSNDIGPCVTPLPTQCTLIGFLSRVNQHMPFHSPGVSKLFAT